MTNHPALDSAISYGTATAGIGGGLYLDYVQAITNLGTAISVLLGVAILVLRFLYDWRKLRDQGK